MFKKISYILLGMTLMVGGTVLAAPYFTYQRTLLPETNNAFDLGTTTSVWRDLFVTQICLSGDCKSAWPTGGSGTADGYGFIINSYGGVNVQSTTTGLWLKALTPYSLIASSTLFTYASTTQLDVTGAATSTFGAGIQIKQYHPYAQLFGLDTDTGIGFDGPDIMSFHTGGVNRVYINALGNFGIATSSPTSKLEVQGSTYLSSSLFVGGAITATSTLTMPLLTSALLQTDANGLFAEYAGTSCTNQFVRSLSALGVATCATVANTDLANSTISGVALGSNLNSLSNDATLSGSSYNGSATVSDWGINLANANTWSVLQTFNYSSTTAYASFQTSSTTDAYFGTGQGIATIGSLGRLRAVATSTFSLSQFTNDLANLTALDTSLTFSGSYNGSAARTVGLNTANTNTWSVLQNFNYSSSTAYSSFITASSTFGNIGTLTLSTTTTGCLNTGSTGIVYASTCASGLSSYDAWTHPSAGQSATTSLMQLFGQASTSQITATSSAYLATAAGGVGIGTTTTSKLLYVYGNVSGGISRIHRKLTATTGQVGTQDFLAESDTQMADGFGPGLNFLAQDQDGTVNTLGQVFALRNGADNSGGLLFNSFAGGSAITSFMTLPVGANAMGTSTVNQYSLTIASSTVPQFALSAGAGLSQWTMRNAGGLFYLATTTVAGNATSTVSAFSINANGFPTFPSLGTGLVLSTAGLQSTYAGTTCTNQFVRVLSASGAATCATVAAADVSLANLTATNSTLTFSGTYNGSTARTIGLNLGNANTWTAKQIFPHASSTVFSSYISYFGGTATTTIGTNGYVGIASTTPFAQLSINTTSGIYPFIVGSSTNSYFGINAYGGITLSATQPATSTTITLDWSKTPSQVEYRIGTSATTITLINATTSTYWGTTKRVWVCNPGSTAGALTWAGVRWIGTAPTQTTTANQCDLYSFNILRATSSSAYIVAGGANVGLQ